MPNISKDTIYLEPDDEITTVIDKLQQSPNKVVALVLPTRASVFESIVNMKLLKKAATRSKKQIALVTSDPTVMKLAGLTSLHVAKTLQSKPEIPTPEAVADAITIDDEVDQAPAPKKELAKEPAAAADDDSVELDNTDPKPVAAAVAAKEAAKPKKKPIKIPDFINFRNKTALLAVVAVLLLVGGIMAFVVMPRATIAIKTNTKNIDASLEFTASTDAKELDIENMIVPAGEAETKKTDTEKVPATGEKNIGEKAEGSVRFSANVCSPPFNRPPSDIPEGATVVSGGKSFITQNKASFSNPQIGSSCLTYTTGSVDIVAAGQGSSFNLGSGSSFSVSGRPDASGSGSASGGSDEIIKVVSADDIENGKQRLKDRSKAVALDELKAKLTGLELLAIEQTFSESEPKVETSVGPDTQAADVTVTSTVDYAMLGVRLGHLEQILQKRIETAEGYDGQKTQDNGLSTATYSLAEKQSNEVQRLAMKVVAVLGPDINADRIKSLAAGKKRGLIQEEVGRIEGVKDVTVSYSPFWVISTPKSADKIKVVMEQAQ